MLDASTKDTPSKLHKDESDRKCMQVKSGLLLKIG